MKYLVTCSFLEIYNERIFDLLDAGCTGKQLREDVKRGVTIPDLTELTVRNSLEACEVLKAGSVGSGDDFVRFLIRYLMLLLMLYRVTVEWARRQ